MSKPTRRTSPGRSSTNGCAAMPCELLDATVARGDTVVLVSASFEVYLRPLAELLGADDVLAYASGGRHGGRSPGSSTVPTVGARRRSAGSIEWLDRARSGSRAAVHLTAYGDSAGDRELLADADDAALGRPWSRCPELMVARPLTVTDAMLPSTTRGRPVLRPAATSRARSNGSRTSWCSPRPARQACSTRATTSRLTAHRLRRRSASPRAAIYIWNDLLDVDADRRHPTKRIRPIAAGELSIGVGRVARASRLPIIALGAGCADRPVADRCRGRRPTSSITIAYTLASEARAGRRSRHRRAGFVLRAAAGAVAVDVPMSRWFVLCITFGSLFIVVGKRYAELNEVGDGAGTRSTLDEYTVGYLRILLSISLRAALISYCVWAFETSAASAESTWPLYELSIVPMLMALMRYLLVLEEGGGAAPEEVFASDRAPAVPRALLGRRLWSRRLCLLNRLEPPDLATVSARVADVQGWMSPGQASTLYDAAAAARTAARSSRSAASRAGRRSCWRAPLRRASRSSRSIRMPATTVARRRSTGSQDAAADDHADVPRQPRSEPACADRVRHVRDVLRCGTRRGRAVPIDVLYIDGAHRYAPARDDIRRLGRPGRRRRHDADPRLVLVDRRHAGHPPRAAPRLALPLRRPFAVDDDLPGRPRRRPGARARNAGRQLAQLPWFVKNLALKVALDARARQGARTLRAIRARVAVLRRIVDSVRISPGRTDRMGPHRAVRRPDSSTPSDDELIAPTMGELGRRPGRDRQRIWVGPTAIRRRTPAARSCSSAPGRSCSTRRVSGHGHRRWRCQPRRAAAASRASRLVRPGHAGDPVRHRRRRDRQRHPRQEPPRRRLLRAPCRAR